MIEEILKYNVGEFILERGCCNDKVIIESYDIFSNDNTDHYIIVKLADGQKLFIIEEDVIKTYTLDDGTLVVKIS